VGGTFSANGEKRITYILSAGKSKGKRSLGRPRCTWLINIKIDLVELGFGGVEEVMNRRVPLNAEKLSSDYTTCETLE
jgi:hypothetical protein